MIPRGGEVSSSEESPKSQEREHEDGEDGPLNSWVCVGAEGWDMF